jgi:ribosomal protein L28
MIMYHGFKRPFLVVVQIHTGFITDTRAVAKRVWVAARVLRCCSRDGQAGEIPRSRKT